jgi:hypothetical protein
MEERASPQKISILTADRACGNVPATDVGRLPTVAGLSLSPIARPTQFSGARLASRSFGARDVRWICQCGPKLPVLGESPELRCSGRARGWTCAWRRGHLLKKFRYLPRTGLAATFPRPRWGDRRCFAAKRGLPSDAGDRGATARIEIATAVPLGRARGNSRRTEPPDQRSSAELDFAATFWETRGPGAPRQAPGRSGRDAAME